MIFNNNTIYATVWNVKKEDKYIDLQITTSEKTNEGEFVNSSWFPRVIGHAYNSLADVKKGDRIEITKSKFTNERKKVDDQYKSYFSFLIFEAKKVTQKGEPQPSVAVEPQQQRSDNNNNEDLPW